MIYQVDNKPDKINISNDSRTGRILQNCKNLLMTHVGEIPYQRYVGFDVRLYELPITQFRQKLTKELDRVLMFEPNAELVKAECSLQDDGSITIVMTVEVEEEGETNG